MRRECRERFPRHRHQRKPPFMIPACITARASRTCRDACRDRSPAVMEKTFPAFPAHAHPQCCVFGKRPIAVCHMMLCILFSLGGVVKDITFIWETHNTRCYYVENHCSSDSNKLLIMDRKHNVDFFITSEKEQVNQLNYNSRHKAPFLEHISWNFMKAQLFHWQT